jgi:hypothetical protein
MKVEDRVLVRRSADEAFLYLADFARLPEWDPGIVRSRRVDGGATVSVPEAPATGPLVTGARFEVVARFFGRDVPMAYELVRFDSVTREAELVGTAPGIRATDWISVRPVGEPGEARAEVHWRAEFLLSGTSRLFGPLMRPLFSRLARKAMDGLRAKLG